MSITATFVENGKEIYKTDPEAVPAVGEIVELPLLGFEEGPRYRVVQRDWKLMPYQGFNGKMYTLTYVRIVVERRT